METVKFIGRIHSLLIDLKDCPLQEYEDAPRAIVEVYDEFTQAAQDIKEGDKLILLTWLDRADRTVLTTHPRNDATTPLTGVYSTRSPDRPNPIGIHFVEVLKVLPGSRFEVSGLEVLDQTPVIDIKCH